MLNSLLAQHSTAWYSLGISLYAGWDKSVHAGANMGGKTDLERVVAYVPPEWKRELEAWAEKEERSVSWLVAKLVDRALQERRAQ